MQWTEEQKACAIQGMEKTTRKSLARSIRMLRSARHWSQETLAQLSGLNRSYIGSVERSEINIGVDNLEKIARALEVPVDTLLRQPADLPPTVPATNEGLPDTADNRDLKQRITVKRHTLLHALNGAHPQDSFILAFLECRGIKVVE